VSEDFVNKIREFIVAKTLLEKNDRVLIACSGGADSMALVHILFELKDEFNLTLGMAHLNHKIRKEASEDQKFVRKAAKQLRIPFHSKTIDVPRLAKSKGLTLEEGARQCRYDYLHQVAFDHNYNKIAVGHNCDDNIETILFNIIRGAGVAGLKGIQPSRGVIIRPLLNTSKDEIKKWILARKSPFVIDRTNKEVAYTRNRIRLRLLPYLKRNFNPEVDKALLRLSSISTEINGFMIGETLKAIADLTIHRDKSKIILDLECFREYPIALRRNIVREIVKTITGFNYPPDYQAVELFLGFCGDRRFGKKIFRGGAIAEIIGDKITFGTLTEVSLKKRIELPGQYIDPRLGFLLSGALLDSIPSETEIRTTEKNISYMDFGKVKGPVIIRNAVAGDRIKPLGMTGHKKVMDILAENQIPSFLRQSQMVLTIGPKIAWIIGIRASDEFKIVPQTKLAIRLEYAE